MKSEEMAMRKLYINAVNELSENKRSKLKLNNPFKITRHGVKKYYTDADALINDPDVDAVYIATPPDTHKLFGLKVAAVRKPCCIEKPLSTNHIDSLTIYNAFNATKTPLFVSYYRRTLPRFLKVKSWIDEGKVGTIRHIQWQLCKVASEQDLSGEYNWRTDSRVAPGGYFDDLASHGLDLFCSFFGDISEITTSLLTVFD